jgi:hypothetical protein
VTAEYVHPASGRTYREDDPARHFAQLAWVLAEEARRYIYHYERRLHGHDCLDQHLTWLSDPDRIARAMAHTIAALDKAYTAVTVDRDMHTYGLGTQDDEWQRKYGQVRHD